MMKRLFLLLQHSFHHERVSHPTRSNQNHGAINLAVANGQVGGTMQSFVVHVDEEVASCCERATY